MTMRVLLIKSDYFFPGMKGSVSITPLSRPESAGNPLILIPIVREPTGNVVYIILGFDKK